MAKPKDGPEATPVLKDRFGRRIKSGDTLRYIYGERQGAGIEMLLVIHFRRGRWRFYRDDSELIFIADVIAGGPRTLLPTKEMEVVLEADVDE